MTNTPRIKSAIGRVTRVLADRPAAARAGGRTVARVAGSLTCEVTDGDWRLTVDQPDTLGGHNDGPDPGVFGRASLAACLAQGYTLWFAEAGVPLDGVVVTVDSEVDARGMFGVSDQTPAGYRGFSIRVEIDSPVDPARVSEITRLVEARSPWLYNMTQAIPTRITYTASQTAAE